ncbi:MAG: Gfo/Idh/MocA family protein, partial [Pyrinomonadaceae bacterium]
SNRITIGLIGIGRQMMKPNMPQLLNLPDVQVVAVCDVDGWRLEEGRKAVEAHYAAEAGKDDYKGCSKHRDFREILNRKDIDAVMIATPDHWHVPVGIEAAKAGKHFSIEKPLSTCIADGRALCDAVARHKVVTRTDSEFRSLKPFWRVCELVRNERIGKLHTIRTGLPVDTPSIGPQPDMPVPEELNYKMWLGPAQNAPYTEKRVHNRHDLKSRPNWMRISDYTNGMIANWGAHFNDIAQWANNTDRTGPVEVEGTGEFTKGLWNTILQFEVRYRYRNGVELICKAERPYIRFEGATGWVQVEYPDKLTAEPATILESKIEPGEISFANTLQDKADFIQAIKSRTESLEPVEVGHRTISISQLGLIAIKLGYKLNWDPDKERFSDNAANALLSVPARDWWRNYGI